MIISSVIGFFLCILCIWILKNSREDNAPVLKMWHALGLGISSVIPLWNFLIGLSILIVIGIAYLADDDLGWKANKGVPSKLNIFLNKTIS